MPATKLFEIAPTRRRFLQGITAAVGVSTVVPTWLANVAGAAVSPLATTDGMVVVVTLRGGNDALNTLVPLTGAERSRYDSLRGTLAVPGATTLPISATRGLHPKLRKLHTRYGQGQVAFVEGIALAGADMSHFTTLDTMMAGTTSAQRSTGWLGRYLDDTPNWASGVAGLTFANGNRLLLVGERSKVPVVPSVGGLWGSSTAPGDTQTQTSVRTMGASSSGLGGLADRAAAMNVVAMEATHDVNRIFDTLLPTPPLTRSLVMAARSLAANIGTRAISVELTGWDTHALQNNDHPVLLGQLDDAIDAFWTALPSHLQNRVCMVVVSEFGRRAAVNGSLGTDHGTAGLAMVIGGNVKGGVTGQAPSLTQLDAAGNLVPTVDLRSLYATVLSGWLGADDREVLGGTFAPLDVFAAGPGAARPAWLAAAARSGGAGTRRRGRRPPGGRLPRPGSAT